jgi:hypothetical protein
VHFGTAGVLAAGVGVAAAAAGEMTTAGAAAAVVGAGAAAAGLVAAGVGVGVALGEVPAAVVDFLPGVWAALAWFLPGKALQASQRMRTASTPARARRRQ